jgi:hypothetical protein
MRGMRTTIIMFAALSALAAAGCSSSGSTAPGDDAGQDAGQDAGDDAGGDTDSDTDTWNELWDWDCEGAIATPCPDDFDYPEPYELQLDLTALGLSAVRSSRSATAILAERPTETGVEPVVAVWLAWEDDAVVVGLVDPPAEPLHAVGLASMEQLAYWGDSGLVDAEATLGYAAVALLCGSSTCDLYGLVGDEAGQPVGLVPVPGGAVPLPEADAVVFVSETGLDAEPSRICAAGDGVACFDGTAWNEEVPPGGAVLRAISAAVQLDTEPSYLIAAGDGGRIITNRGGAWSEIDSGTATDFLSVGAHRGFWAAGGTGGLAFGDGDHAVSCVSESTFSAMFVHEAYSWEWYNFGLTAFAADRVVELSIGPSACYRPTAFAGTPLDGYYGPYATDGCEGHALTTGALYRRSELECGIGE